MHLWPSIRVRDSFKTAYLKTLEWNLHRMNSEKKRQSDCTGSSSNDSNDNRQKLLDDDDTGKGASFFAKVLAICRELLLILSCCYCCFCCGACVDGENS